MPEWFVTLVLKSWLVVAVAMFVVITVVCFLPGSGVRMDRHARIPFSNEDERDGEA